MSRTIELLGSRKGRNAYDKSTELELRYKVYGVDDVDTAIALVAAEAPATLVDPCLGGTLYANSFDWDQEGPDVFLVNVGYVDPYSQETQLQVGEYRVTFSTTGGTAHITTSKATVNRYAPSGKTATNHFQSIGVTDNGEVQGCDIVVPQLRFTITYRQPQAVITDAYVRQIEAMTGTVNDATWKGRAAGEVLFMGADGFQGNRSDPEISYQFARQPNLTGLTIGSITSVAKGGWNYLWVEFEDVDDATAKRLAKKPRAVHVERVYESSTFTALGIG